ncbi:MAG: hypothetical protein ACK4N5_13260 [Myxococcales bacterium]
MRLAVALFALSLTACGLSVEDWNRLVAEAAACEPGDTCVHASPPQCACSAPVNQKRAQEIADAAKQVNCGGMAVACAPVPGDPVCRNGRCVIEPR